MRSARRTFLAACAIAATGARAGLICGPIVMDPSNIGKNAIEAVEAVQGIAQRVAKYQAMLQQLVAAGQQAKALVGSAQALAAQAKELADVTSYGKALKQLYGSATQMQQALERRLQMARSSATSWEDYAASERQRIQANVQGAIDTAAEEQRILERVQRDFSYARQMESLIKGSSGIHAEAQNMNRILNRMITQQAEFARVVAPLGLGQNAAVEAALNRARFRQEKLDQTKVLDDMTTSVRQSEQAARQALEGLK